MKKILYSILISAVCSVSFAEVIEDNSFLIEEAYNQETGVVQFIQGVQYLEKSKSLGYTFTNEIPMGSQLHQFSYTIPYNKIDSSQSVDGTNIQGVGDILLNYRYQLMNEERISMAPRVSLVMPSGDYKKGLGAGAVGVQFNQAVSIKVTPKFVNHYNLGFTLTPDAKEAGGEKATTISFNYGTSIVYLATENLNFLCEIVGASTESPQAVTKKSRQDSFFVVPGFRYAFNFESGLQVVPGAAYMSGVGPSERENGTFVYLSFEKKLW